MLATELVNLADRPALLVRVTPVRARSGDRTRPALLSDNDVALMPGDLPARRL